MRTSATHAGAIVCLIAAIGTLGVMTPTICAAEDVRDVSFFLRRMRTLDHLPELENSHTAMSSTWDRKGGNEDGLDYKHIEGNRNVLLDVDGPGCVHRIFTGRLGNDVAGTRIQFYFDGAEAPALDYTVEEFFTERGGPLPYPLVFNKTYPGTLFPFPFARHCRIQLVNEQSRNWGNYWQVTYTRYSRDTQVKTLAWPLGPTDQAEVKAVCEAWLMAESAPPEASRLQTFTTPHELGPGQTWKISLDGRGVIRQMRVALGAPLTAEVLKGLRLRMTWDGAGQASVDVPFGYFFGELDSGRWSETRFNSLLLGTTQHEAYCCLPMPFERGAELTFENRSSVTIKPIIVRLRVDRIERLPANWGRLHATWLRHRAATDDSPRFGPQQVPVQQVLATAGPGKYVGVLLSVDWPYETWWGEGDWLIWTDEDGWPPSYHGTGSEEYFNSGWCRFDRKAVSGFVATLPGDVAVYSFHLNDAFQFHDTIRVVEETVGCGQAAQKTIEQQHPYWSSTAFWYALPAQPAMSTTVNKEQASSREASQ